MSGWARPPTTTTSRPGPTARTCGVTTTGSLLTVSELPFEETRVYDVVVLGQIADDSLEVQSLVTTVSPSCGEVLGLRGVEQ